MSFQSGHYVKMKGSDRKWVVEYEFKGAYHLKTDIVYQSKELGFYPPDQKEDGRDTIRYWTKHVFPDGTKHFSSQMHTTAHSSDLSPWVSTENK